MPSIVDFLKSQNQDSSYAARTALATKFGIPNYTGTAAQNVSLLDKLQAGGSAATPTPTVTAAPTSLATETPAGTLPSNTATSPHGSLFDYKIAVQQALNEAAAKRRNSQLDTLQPYMTGLPNNALSEVLGTIKQGANLDATSVYKTFLDTQSEEARLATQKQQNGLDLVRAMAQSGGLGDLPDSALLDLSRTTGIDAGNLLAWRQGIKSKSDLEIKKTLQEIEQSKSATVENYAQAAHARALANQNSMKSISATYQEKYSLPSTVTQEEFNKVRNLILQNKAAAPNVPYYELWGALAKELQDNNVDPTTYDGLFWDFLAPTNSKGQSGYDQWAIKNGLKNIPKGGRGITADQIRNVQNAIKSGR